MKKTYRILPVYTGDVSGFASALYEFGGMCVIHDPSGCNSTYNTHDEIRWYDKESLIYISGLNDIDAITGNDDKLIDNIVYAASEMKPKFIALANSPLPYLNGTDFKGICRILEQKTGLPCFYVQTNAMHDYTKGASEAYLAFARKLLKPLPKHTGNKPAANILGATPLDHAGTVFDISNEYETVSNWSYGTSYENALKAASADVNIVVSSSGLAVAKYMREEFGITYKFIGDYLDVERSKTKCYVVGEPVTSGFVAAQIKRQYGKDFNVIATTEITDGLLGRNDIKAHGEEEIRNALADAEIIIADPLFKLVAPKSAKFIELPHFAMSGRLYLKQIPDLTKTEEYYHEP